MSKDDNPGPESQREILDLCVEAFRGRLPEKWELLRQEVTMLSSDRRADEVLRLISPDRAEALLVLEAKRIVEKRDLPQILAQLEGLTRYLPNSFPCVIARYLSPSVRAALQEQRVSYIDATGNMRLTLSAPAIFISDRGQDRDPWRGAGRPRGTLKGAPAGRVVRALIDYSKPWTMRELVSISGSSTGATYRVIEYLQGEGLIARDSDGRVIVPNWRGLLAQWSKDYGFLRSSQVIRFIAPRGIGNLVERAAQPADLTYAFTGTVAAEQWSAYAPARSAMVYVDSIVGAANAWGLRPADAGANVLLAEPESDVVYARSLVTTSGLVVAAPSQVAVDLMTGPGRNPAEAEELLDWMERNERDWRI